LRGFAESIAVLAPRIETCIRRYRDSGAMKAVASLLAGPSNELFE